MCVYGFWIVSFTVVVAVRLPHRTAVDDRGPIEGGGVGVCDVGVVVVQRAVLVELWRKIVHAALGFPAFALAPLPLACSVLDALRLYGSDSISA